MSLNNYTPYVAKAAWLLIALMMSAGYDAGGASAHSFNVALIVTPHSASDASAPARQFKDGFMLATTQRDAHPDNEADGHLGGLDVYVTVLDKRGLTPADIARQLRQNQIDIVVMYGADAARAPLGKTLKGSTMLLLRQGQTPFTANSTAPAVIKAVKAFTAAYKTYSGRVATPAAAQGYNAARRIDVAVRAQDAVSDRAALRASFNKTKRAFDW